MMLPEVEAVFARLHRLHLARASRRGWAVDEASAATLAAVAVGFADLAGFTSLAGQVSATELAGIVDAFDEHVATLVLTNGGQVVKLIGDEVMFVADDVGDGLRIAQALAAGLPGAEDLPAVRVGLAAGEVLNRDGDYYGSVVNLAARLVDLAEPGEVLLSDAAAGRRRRRGRGRGPRPRSRSRASPTRSPPSASACVDLQRRSTGAAVAAVVPVAGPGGGPPGRVRDGAAQEAAVGGGEDRGPVALARAAADVDRG